MERVDAGIIEKKALKKQISDLLFERDYTIFE
jgi:hypothetical protein